MYIWRIKPKISKLVSTSDIVINIFLLLKVCIVYFIRFFLHWQLTEEVPVTSRNRKQFPWVPGRKDPGRILRGSLSVENHSTSLAPMLLRDYHSFLWRVIMKASIIRLGATNIHTTCLFKWLAKYTDDEDGATYLYHIFFCKYCRTRIIV